MKFELQLARFRDKYLQVTIVRVSLQVKSQEGAYINKMSEYMSVIELSYFERSFNSFHSFPFLLNSCDMYCIHIVLEINQCLFAAPKLSIT